MNTSFDIDALSDPIRKTMPGALKLLTILAVMYTLYLTKTLVLPIFVAAFIALFSSPLVRLLSSFHIPKAAGSLLVVSILLASMTYVVSLLIEPASRWLQAVPIISDKIMFEFEGAAQPLADLQKSVAGADGQQEPVKDAMNSTMNQMLSVLAESTVIFLVQLAATVVITYFFLVYGEDLMRNLVKAQRNFTDKKNTVTMFQTIRDDVSRYVLVVSTINVGLGLATAGAMKVIGVEDALLWGALATILNFAPYLGPLLLAIILTGVGFLEFHSLSQIALVPGTFLVLNLIESQFVTPTMLGRRFNINPLLVVLWMFLWGWLWGAVGMLIAIPILMGLKIMAKHMDFMGDWVHVIDGPAVHPKPLPVEPKASVE